METLGYLHLACANESEDLQSCVQPLRILDSLRWQKLPSVVWLKFLSIAVGLTILSLASAAMALLQEGDRGPEVGALQSQLANQGCYAGSVDEIFGSQTREAVIACQRKLGVEADGVVGPATVSALSGSSRPTFNPPSGASSFNGSLRLGSKGPAVSDLQRQLSAAGYYSGPIDGDFGPQTEAAVIQFQRQRGLVADGVVGFQVYQALDSGVTRPLEPASSRPLIVNGRELAPGSSGSEVEELQRRLKVLGYFDASPTGYYGPITQDAVSRFQASQRLPQTGIADARTLNQLGINTAGPVDRNRYSVVIPKQGADTLARVRRYFPTAVERQSRLGDYVEAGRYPNVERADRESNLLRIRGLDARVAYR